MHCIQYLKTKLLNRVQFKNRERKTNSNGNIHRPSFYKWATKLPTEILNNCISFYYKLDV